MDASQLPHLKFLIWPDASQQQISSLLQRCPRLIINPGPKRFSSLLPGRRLPPEADMWRPLDSPAVAAVSQLWWAGLCGGNDRSPSGTTLSLPYIGAYMLRVFDIYPVLAVAQGLKSKT